MPLYDASFVNLYAYPMVELPTLEESAVPSCKMYGIFDDGGNVDYTGPGTQDVAQDIGTVSGSGLQIENDYVGDNPFGRWCESPNENNPSTSAGFQTVYAFGIVYVASPGLTALVDDEVPMNRILRNKMRAALRNASRLANGMPFNGIEISDIEDLPTGILWTSASDLVELQQFIVDNFEVFIHPDKISSCTGLSVDQCKPTLDSNDRITIGGHYVNFFQTTYANAWEYFCKEIVGLCDDSGNYGFPFATEWDDDAGVPVLQYPNSDRVCQYRDFITQAAFKGVAMCLDVLRASHRELTWTAKDENNDSSGMSVGDHETWDSATDDAEDNMDAGSDNSAPAQQSIGNYEGDSSSEGDDDSSSSSSSYEDPGSDELPSSSSSGSDDDSSLDSSFDSDPGSSEDSAGWSSEWFSDFYSDWWSDNF